LVFVPTGGLRRRLERTRFVWALGLLLVIGASFLLGPVLGLFLGLPLLGPLYSLGFELARPVSRRPATDRVLGRVLHAALWSYVVLLLGLVAWVRVASPSSEFSMEGGPLVRALVAVFLPSAAGVVAATFLILRARGGPLERRIFRVALWAGLALGVLYWPVVNLDRWTHDFFGPDTFRTLLALEAYGVAGLGAVAALFAYARILFPRAAARPRTVPARLGEPESGAPARAPTFEPHRG
jgi:hypothetical protein